MKFGHACWEENLEKIKIFENTIYDLVYMAMRMYMILCLQKKVGGKKLVRGGGKKLLILCIWIFSFIVMKNWVEFFTICVIVSIWNLVMLTVTIWLEIDFSKILIFSRFSSQHVQISFWAIVASFKYFLIIFCAKWTWRFIFLESKVFYPLH